MQLRRLITLTALLGLVLVMSINPKPVFASENINFIVTKIDPGVTGKAIEGTKYTAHVTFKLVSNHTSVAGAQIVAFHNNYPAVLKDKSGLPITKVTFLPNNEKTFNFNYHAQKISVLKCVIDTPPVQNLYKEQSENDNTAYKTVLSQDNQPIPVIPEPTLQLTAVSQGGKDMDGNFIPPVQRPAGTAKWTDTITAKLTIPPAPDLGDYYTLKQWKLESAEVVYPRQNPDFTFGSPEEPVGTVTKQMNITGNRTATVQFKEDWSLNGTQIFDILKQRRVAGPTEYPIKVTYKIHWVYDKGELEYAGNGYTCNMKSYDKYINGTITADILVNGTGVNSLAH